MANRRYLLTGLVLIVCFTIVIFTSGNAAAAAAKGDPKAGLDVYTKNCVRCHGVSGKGDGPAAKLIKSKPVDWSTRTVLTQLSEGDLVAVITKGGAAIGKTPLMTPFKLSDQELHNVIAYILQIGGNP